MTTINTNKMVIFSHKNDYNDVNQQFYKVAYCLSVPFFGHQISDNKFQIITLHVVNIRHLRIK